MWQVSRVGGEEGGCAPGLSLGRLGALSDQTTCLGLGREKDWVYKLGFGVGHP